MKATAQTPAIAKKGNCQPPAMASAGTTLKESTLPTGTQVAQIPRATPRILRGNHIVTQDGAATPISPIPTPSTKRLAMRTSTLGAKPPNALPMPKQATESKITFLRPTLRAMKAAGNAKTTPMMPIALISVPKLTASSAP